MFRHVWEIMRNCLGSLVLLSKCHQAQKVPQWHDGKWACVLRVLRTRHTSFTSILYSLVLGTVWVEQSAFCKDEPGAKGQADRIPRSAEPLRSEIVRLSWAFNGRPLFPLPLGRSAVSGVFVEHRFARVISSIQQTTLALLLDRAPHLPNRQCLAYWPQIQFGGKQ